MKNKVKNLIVEQEITRYRFWKQTGISRSVAYKLCDDPFYIPRTNVIDAICRVFQVQPGDLLEYVPEPEEAEPLKAEQSDRTATEPITTEEAPLQEQAYQAYDWEVYYRDGTAQSITTEEEVPPLGAEATELQDPANTEQQVDHGV